MKVLFIKLLFLAVAVCCLPSAVCHGQPVSSPDINCISVNASNGDVTLTWSTPVDPGGNFVDYKIFSSPLSPLGPYGLVGTVTTYTQTAFTVVGANANAQRVYFKIQTDYNPGPVLAAPKDTFSTIFLSVVNPANGTAQLSWNKISFQPLSTSTGWYRIYREYPAGIWTLRDSTQNLTYSDVIDVCNASLNYRIEMGDITGCTSVSNVAGGPGFTDMTPPTISPVDTVSVNAADDAIISWYPSPSPDGDSVKIYRSLNSIGPWNLIATVPVPLTTYINTSSTAGSGSEYYRVAFKDSCGQLSPLGTAHRTIYLSVSFNICAATASLVWNKYINMNPALGQYQVLKSVNSGPYALIGTTTASDSDYVDTGLTIGNSYCYMVRAWSSDLSKSSSSNRVCFSASVTQPPLYQYNRFATVISDKQIDIKAHVDPLATSVKYYHILRATNGIGVFSIVDIQPYTSGTTITYSDDKVNTQVDSYVYKVNAMDSCGNVITTSNSDTTVLLKVQFAGNADAVLTWNDYGDFMNGTDHYNVYRAQDGVWDPGPIASVPYTGTGGYYNDCVCTSITSKFGIFSYYVVAVEKGVNTFGFTDSSASNISTLRMPPVIFTPNAFTPNGDAMNDIFKPVVSFIDTASYSLKIFDRTGTTVATYFLPSEGWDGKKKGHPCQEGVYMYLLNTKSSSGDDVQLYGTVSLIR